MSAPRPHPLPEVHRLGRDELSSPRPLLVGLSTAGRRAVFAHALTADAVFSVIAAHPATLAACLMPDHLHWLLATAEPRAVVARARAFTASLAAHLGLRGALWRPGQSERAPANRDELTGLAEQLCGNPVRAGLVSEAAQWPWQIRRIDRLS